MRRYTCALLAILGLTTPTVSLCHTIPTETYSITITITGIRNTKGLILLKFYDDETRYPETNGFRIVKVSKSLIKNESITVTYHGFKAQHMGVSLLDDENSNLKLDFGFMFPKEGHAFSDYHHSAMRKPVYEDFRFLLSGNKSVSMKMKYY
jgi:uncharacterized protein (DUF2141 family)